MRTTLVLGLVLIWGCNSDNKVQNGLDVPDGPQSSDPGQTDQTTPNAGTQPSTQTTPTTTDDGGNGGDDDDSASGGPGTGTGSDTGDLSDDEFCQKAATLAGFLDKFQTPDDGKVTFCHAGGSHYNKIDTDISACLPHLNHRNDVFPTSGCDS